MSAVVGQVLVITLDRPKANAIDVGTSRELHAAFTRLRDDPALRVGILTGAGDKFFSAGWDLLAGEVADADYGPGGFAGLTELTGLGKPVIAAVNGLAFGGGFELVLACDLVVAAAHATFALTEVTLGLVPDSGGLLRLPARLPRPIAVELLLTGRRLTAAEAERWGLVNKVVDAERVLAAEPVAPAERVLAAAMELAETICRAAPLSVAAVLEWLSAAEDAPTEFARLRDLPGYQRMLASDDAREGARAFAAKRPPAWTGQ
jgi:crotonobetainyl-CoA hydratase